MEINRPFLVMERKRIWWNQLYTILRGLIRSSIITMEKQSQLLVSSKTIETPTGEKTRTYILLDFKGAVKLCAFFKQNFNVVDPQKYKELEQAVSTVEDLKSFLKLE